MPDGLTPPSDLVSPHPPSDLMMPPSDLMPEGGGDTALGKAGRFGKGALLGAAELLPEIVQGGANIASAAARKMGTEAPDLGVTAAAKRVKGYAQEHLPAVDPNDPYASVGRMAGQLVPYGAAALAGPVGIVGAGIAGGAQMGAGAEDQADALRAQGKSVSQSDVDNATLLEGAVGTIISLWPGGKAALAMVPGAARSGIVGYAARTIANGGLAGGIGAVQTALNDAIEKYTIDPEKVIGEGAASQGALMAVAGAIAHGAVHEPLEALARRRQPPPPPPGTETPSPPPPGTAPAGTSPAPAPPGDLTSQLTTRALAAAATESRDQAPPAKLPLGIDLLTAIKSATDLERQAHGEGISPEQKEALLAQAKQIREQFGTPTGKTEGAEAPPATEPDQAPPSPSTPPVPAEPDPSGPSPALPAVPSEPAPAPPTEPAAPSRAAPGHPMPAVPDAVGPSPASPAAPSPAGEPPRAPDVNAPLPNRQIASAEAVTSTGRVVPVDYALVEAGDLVTSHTDDMRLNPQYPQGVQPRDRTRAASEMQIQSMINPERFRPDLLGPSPDAANGAPIVGPDGVVESGNMRSMAMRRAYDQGLPAAEAYRSWLQGQGYNTEGMKAPLLVRINRGNMTPADREAFAREANKPAQLAMSASEQAMADAKALPASMLSLHRTGDIGLAGNRDFVKAFLRDIVGPNESARMIGADGSLSVEGRRRIESALLARAFDDAGIVSALTEDPDNGIKAIGGALTDVAPAWAVMRGEVESGAINPDVDISKHVVAAANIVRQARAEGRNVAEYVNQRDMFGGGIPPETEAVLRIMFRGKDFTKPRGRDKVADALRDYVTQARETKPTPGLFGKQDVVGPQDILSRVNAKQTAESEPTADLFGRAPDSGQRPAQLGEDGQGPERGPGGPEAGAAPLEDKPPPDVKPGVYRNLTDDFSEHAAKNLRVASPLAINAHAAAYVMQRGKEMGYEVIALYNKALQKVVAAATNGQTNTVNVPPFQHTTGDRTIVVHHNHPSRRGMSNADFAGLGFDYVHSIFAHTADGEMSAATLTSEMDALLKTRRVFAPRIMVGAIHEAASRAVLNVLNRAIIENRIPTEVASIVHREIVGRALDAAGVVHYIGTRDLSRIPDAVYREAMQKAVEEATLQIHRTFPAATTKLKVDANALALRPSGIVRPNRDQGMAQLLGEPAAASGQVGPERQGGNRPDNPPDQGSATPAQGEKLKPTAPQARPDYSGPTMPLVGRQGTLFDERHGVTETPEFKRWFGDSKAVNENGAPRVYYHGTSKDAPFHAFKAGRHGVWFTADPREASTYAEENDSQGHRYDGRNFIRTNTASRVMPTYLRLENPYTGEYPPELARATNYKAAQSSWFDTLRRQGYDGWMPNNGVAVAFDAKQIKSAIGNRGTFDPNNPSILRDEADPFKEEHAPPFFSALTKGVSDLNLAKAHPSQWLGTLDGLRNKGVKEEELAWSGVRDWLKDQKGLVTKDQVLDHLRQNEVQIKEVTHGTVRDETGPDEQAGREHGPEWDRLTESINRVRQEIDARHHRPGIVADRGFANTSTRDLENMYPTLESQRDALHERMVDETMARQGLSGKPTKFGKYTLPGGENYREMLLTMPEPPKSARSRDLELKVNRGDRMSVDEREEYHRLAKEGDARRTFTAGHFDEPNVLAHVRMNDRTGPRGEKILHVEEIQSDWHQKGRKEGYAASPEEIAAADERLALSLPGVHGALHRNDQLGFDTNEQARRAVRQHPDWADRWDVDHADRPAIAEYYDAYHNLSKVKAASKVPDAPLKNTWHEMALKRVIRHAAENGYDKVTWTRGETQAARYDLSKKIQRLIYSDGELTAFDHNGKQIMQEDVAEKDLPDHIGKEAADKLLAAPDEGTRVENGQRVPWREISGLDLKTEHKGMKGFYDKMLPAAANKIAKPFGAKVGEGEVQTAQGYGKTWSVYNSRGDHVRNFDSMQEAYRYQEDPRNGLRNGRVRENNEVAPKTEPVHSLDITDPMRESAVGKGFALFDEPAPFSSESIDERASRIVKESTPGMLVRRLISPGSFDASAKAAAAMIRKVQGDAYVHGMQVAEKLRAVREHLDNATPEVKEAFANAVDTGRFETLPDDLRDLAQGLREVTQQETGRLQRLGQRIGKPILAEAIENYLGRYWKPRGAEAGTPESSNKVLTALSVKQPLTGPKSFLKPRHYDTWAEARAAGLEPAFDNPADAHLAKLAEMNRYWAGTVIAQAAKTGGFAEFFKVHEPHPDGYMELEGPEFRRKERIIQDAEGNETTVPEGAWYAPEGFARVMNNYTSRGLEATLFRDPVAGLRNIGNGMNLLQLGFSAFHPVFTTIDAQISRVGMGIDNAMRGRFGKAAMQIAEGMSPVNWVTNVRDGNRLLKSILRPDDSPPEMRRLVDAFGSAGGRIWMERILRPTDEGAIKFWKEGAIGKALRSAAIKYPGSPIKQALNIAGRAIETTSAPVFDLLVPRQKLGVFSRLAEDWLDRNPQHSDTDYVRAMQDIWETVDNRLGQMVYDNLFWNKTLKDIAFLSTRSVGWNMGSIREIGGGIAETGKFAGNLAKGRFNEAEWTRRMSYLIALPVMTGVYGAMYQYLATGEGPQELKDYMFPRTGLTRNDQTPERISIPTYIKDVYAWSTRPLQTAKNKANPMVSFFAQAIEGRDYYGDIIANYDDPIVKQVEDAMLWAVGSVTPFSFQATSRMYQERSGPQATLGMLGFTPAPGYIANPAAEEKWNERQHMRDVKKKARDEAKRAAPSVQQAP